MMNNEQWESIGRMKDLNRTSLAAGEFAVRCSRQIIDFQCIDMLLENVSRL